MCDRYAGYLWFGRVQLCWAHLRRDFQAMIERGADGQPIGDALLSHAEVLFDWWHRVRDGTLSRRQFRKIIDGIAPAVEGLLARGVSLGVRGVSGSCADMLDHKLALWTFVDNTGVEPTNNHAERELRAFVLWRKKSFGSQSDRGCRFAARIMTVAHSLRKQRRHVLDYLTDACRAALVDQPAPSLLPAMSAP